MNFKFVHAVTLLSKTRAEKRRRGRFFIESITAEVERKAKQQLRSQKAKAR